jgi:hypothetical protein
MLLDIIKIKIINIIIMYDKLKHILIENIPPGLFLLKKLTTTPVTTLHVC